MAQDFTASPLDGTHAGLGVDRGFLITEIIYAVERSVESGQPAGLASIRAEFSAA